jgi:hypothetical protein
MHSNRPLDVYCPGQSFFSFQWSTFLRIHWTISPEFALWAVLLIHWLKNHATVDIIYEKRGFYRALWVWALTDISIVLAFAPFILPGV